MEGKYLYFASGTTAPDAVGESILYPVNSIAGVEPFAPTKLKIFFTPRNTSSFVEDDNEFVVIKILLVGTTGLPSEAKTLPE